MNTRKQKNTADNNVPFLLEIRWRKRMLHYSIYKIYYINIVEVKRYKIYYINWRIYIYYIHNCVYTIY